MTFKATPVDMISAPNYYGATVDGQWLFTSANAQTIWFTLSIVDALGTRPYTPAMGATLTLTFQRSDLIAVNVQGNLTNTIQNVVKTATAFAGNRTLWSVAMTSQDIAKSLSGTVKFNFKESGVETEFVQNWLVKKTLTAPGC